MTPPAAEAPSQPADLHDRHRRDERQPPHPPSDRFLQRIPRDFARLHLIISTGRQDTYETLLCTESTDPSAIFNVGVRLGSPVTIEHADPEHIARRIDAAYQGPQHSRTPSLETSTEQPETTRIEDAIADAQRDLLSTDGKAPVVRLVDAILFEALGLAASDVHIHPLERSTLVRYRIDGVLHTARQLAPELAGPVLSRIKVMGRMDIAEKRLPQDGRASVTIGRGAAARPIDLRISTLPTSHGERGVIRLLDQQQDQARTTFESLGLPPDAQESYLQHAGRSSGIILVTGPTGSGKTTTLYTTLRWLASRGVETIGGGLNIMTIEDPIEYELSSSTLAISQAQVNAKKGINFASGLRHILRQDPDVIMIGEIRDAETARIAIQSSLTGHLVFSTLHTNDAASAITRLIDLGIEPYLIGASLSGVLAQRLVRRVHHACDGNGCDRCLNSGFQGRVGIFEWLPVSEPVREAITARAGPSTIRATANDEGWRTLYQEGRRLAAEGITTNTEVDRVTIDTAPQEAPLPRQPKASLTAAHREADA